MLPWGMSERRGLKAARVLWITSMVVLTVIGLAGLPEDWRRWMNEWLPALLPILLHPATTISAAVMVWWGAYNYGFNRALQGARRTPWSRVTVKRLLDQPENGKRNEKKALMNWLVENRHLLTSRYHGHADRQEITRALNRVSVVFAGSPEVTELARQWTRKPGHDSVFFPLIIKAMSNVTGSPVDVEALDTAFIPNRPAEETCKVRYKHGEFGAWREQQLPLQSGLVHRMDFDDAGRRNVIEVDAAYRLVFLDHDDLWAEQDAGTVRRYSSGPFAEGHGLKVVPVQIEEAALAQER